MTLKIKTATGSPGASYSQAGVDTGREEQALQGLLKWVNKTREFRQGLGQVALPIGYFASVLDLGNNMGLAISTDGVGTKILVAQMMNRYDTIGIDCVAMNVNDVLCVGAEPISMVDYIALQKPHPVLLEDIARGLYKGAEIAGINICGGEIAQVKELIRGKRRGWGFDLAGTCVGLVPLDRIIVGQDIEENDVVIGLRSSGIHSNGLTMARRILFQERGFPPDRYFPEIGRTLGEELLEPTRIYVREVKELLRSALRVKALAHITGDGLLNLTRVKSETGFIIENFPEPHPIFRLIQTQGQVSDAEMFMVYNMGIGFCLVIPEREAKKAMAILETLGTEAYQLGYTFPDRKRRVLIKPKNLVGKGSRFYPNERL